jgi:hypothetical protein
MFHFRAGVPSSTEIAGSGTNAPARQLEVASENDLLDGAFHHLVIARG